MLRLFQDVWSGFIGVGKNCRSPFDHQSEAAMLTHKNLREVNSTDSIETAFQKEICDFSNRQQT